MAEAECGVMPRALNFDEAVTQFAPDVAATPSVTALVSPSAAAAAAAVADAETVPSTVQDSLSSCAFGSSLPMDGRAEEHPQDVLGYMAMSVSISGCQYVFVVIVCMCLNVTFVVCAPNLISNSV
jgi:hypothetical protein